MQQWLRISILLCVFGFLKELRPSEPYIYDYLSGKWFNFTENQITQEIYTVGTYATLVIQLLVFLITDILRYKPLIVTLGLAGVGVWSLLIFGNALYQMQIVEVFYAVFVAAEVAYYTYIYATVDTEHYQQVTSHTRAAILAGRAISGISSQLLTSFNVLDYYQLNFITFTSVTVATIWALFLPSVGSSVYFHRHDDDDSANKALLRYRNALKLMRDHVVNAFTGLHTLEWSLWYALSTCGYVQVENYMQPLYAQIEPSVAYNGAVEASITLLGFLATLLAGHLKVLLKLSEHSSELMLVTFASVQCALIVAASQTTEIYVCYALYILYGVLYHFMITVASAQIAVKINIDSYGLVFGINQFVALCFNTILTALVVSGGLGLSIRDQYLVYGCYIGGIAAIFVGILIWRGFKKSVQ